MKYLKQTFGVMLLLLLVVPSMGKEELVYSNPENLWIPDTTFSSNSPILLDDYYFPFRSEFFDFDIQFFLEDQASDLAGYRGPMFSLEENAAEMAELVAHYYGINPKVLLTVMEVQSGLISQPPLGEMENWILGYRPRADELEDGLCPGDGKLLFSQLILLARRLNEGYFAWRDFQGNNQDVQPEIIFRDGSASAVPTEVNAATFAIFYALAEVNSQEQWQELITDAPQGFYHTYWTLFKEDPLQAPDTHIQAGPYPSTIQFPWPNGQSWYYSQGPQHSTNALDFAPGGGSGCLYSKCFNNWIVAAASGTVVDTSHLWVKIDHGNGWMTGYFHTPGQDKISNGVRACRGQQIGHPGCCGSDGCTYCYPCGASCPGCCASGTHTHFTLFKDGSPETWVGKTISGWTMQSNGCLTKGGSSLCPGSWIASDISKDCCCCSGQANQFSCPVEPEAMFANVADDVQITENVMPDATNIFDTFAQLETYSESIRETPLAQTPISAIWIPPTSAHYRISKSVVGIGGGYRTSTHYVMQGTSGQTTGVGRRESSRYILQSGYWGGWAPGPHSIYLPVVLRCS